jgi:5-methylcytosine-specific restriction protein A
MATKRPFRKPESYESERVTRNAVEPFLLSRGFAEIQNDRRKFGLGESQAISAVSPQGERMRMRVRLGWRRDGDRREGVARYAAAQLRARLIDGDWIETVRYLVVGDNYLGRLTTTILAG